MKRFSMVMTMAMLLILSILPAYAIEVFPITDFKFTGNTAVFRPGDGYLPGGSETQVGDIIYSLGKVTHTVDPATGDTYGLDPDEEYTYYIGGLQIIVPDTPESVGYLGVDPNSPATDPISGAPVAWMVVWKDTIPDFALADGPAANPAWGSPYPTADPTGTIINDGTPWITGVLEGLPTWLDPRAVALTHITSFNPISGHTASFIHLQSLNTPWGPITGSFNSQITSGYYGISNTGLSLDAQMLNTLQRSLVNGWFNRDNDPVTAAFAFEGGEGCTPGYWKSKNHLDSWAPTGLSPEDDDFDATFGVDFFDPDIILLQAVRAKGGGIKKVARHGTAALLNALHPAVNYPFTVAEVIAFVQARDVDTLAEANELSETCPAEFY